MYFSSMRSSIVAMLFSVVALFAGSSAFAETVRWDVFFNSAWKAGGNYTVDQNGLFSLSGSQTIDYGDGNQVTINDVHGDIDPILFFSANAITGASAGTFSFVFTLPVSMSGLISTNSSVSYSLTSGSALPATISPASGFTNVVTAEEVDTPTCTSVPCVLNNGVDVGNTFSTSAGPITQNSPVYTASNSFTVTSAYDLMRVKVNFDLTANSSVGISGFVNQVPPPVPVPAGLPLLFSGLGLLGANIRRRRAA